MGLGEGTCCLGEAWSLCSLWLLRVCNYLARGDLLPSVNALGLAMTISLGGRDVVVGWALPLTHVPNLSETAVSFQEWAGLIPHASHRWVASRHMEGGDHGLAAWRVS